MVDRLSPARAHPVALRALFRAITLSLATLSLATLMTSCTAASRTPAPKGTTGATDSGLDQVGVTVFAANRRQPVPTISGTTLQGQRFSSQQFRGQVFVVNVWASWCKPCRTESPALAQLARTLSEQHVQFLGLNESDTHSAALAFATSVGATYPQLSDPDQNILIKLRVLPMMGIPSTLVVDAHGRAAARVIGPVTSSVLSGLVHAAQVE